MKVLKGRKLIIASLALIFIFTVSALGLSFILGKVNALPDSSPKSTIEVWSISDIPETWAGSSGWNYKLMKNIKLDTEIEPLFKLSEFTGTFDGNHKTISGLTQNNDSGFSLFGVIGEGGVVKDLGLTNCSISSTDYAGETPEYVGALARVNNGKIQNCYVTGTINLENSTAGGLVGRNYGTIKNSYNKSTVCGEKAGGIAGINGGEPHAGLGFGTIINCYNVGNISGSENVGGIAGENNWEIMNCFNTGDIEGFYNIGGIAGKQKIEGSVIKNCYNTGDIKALENAGGIAGINESGTVSYCYSAARFSAANDTIGGIIGVNNGMAGYYYFNEEIAGDGICDVGNLYTINTSYLVTTAMTDDQTLERSYSMEYLQNGNNWVKPVYDDCDLYYPELSVFANSINPATRAASKESVRVKQGCVTEKPEGTATVTIGNWVYGEEPADVNIETDDYAAPLILYKLAGENDDTATKDVPKNAGNYVLIAIFSENDDFAEKTVYAEFTIFKAKVAKQECGRFTYDGKTKSLPIEESDLYTIINNSHIDAGTYEVKLSLNDKDNYEWEDGSIEDLILEMIIMKANPQYTAPTGLTAKEGQKLSDITLPEGFSWLDGNLSVGAKGQNSFKVRFTPTDTKNYNILEISITIKVVEDVTETEKPEGAATIAIGNWVYGDEPADAVIESDDYTVFTILYKLAGENDDATTAEVPKNAGNYVLIVIFSENDDFAEKTVYAEFTIFKAKVLKPVSNSFTFDNTEKSLEIEETDLYTVSNNSAIFAGTYEVTVSLNDKDNYEWLGGGIEDLILELKILKAKVLKPVSGSFTFDNTEKSLEIEETDLYTVTNNSAVFAGTYEVRLSLTDKENYEWFGGGVEDLILELKILKASPVYTLPQGLTAKEGQKLSNITLPSNFSWVDESLSVGLKGERKFTAKFTPSDTENYNTIEVEITITVSENQTVNPDPKPEPKSNGLSGGAIAGIVVGSVLAVVLIAVLVVVLIKKKKQKEN